MGRFGRTTCGIFVPAAFLLACMGLLADDHAAMAGVTSTLQSIENMLELADETDEQAPVDYGPGPRVKPQTGVAGKMIGHVLAKAALSWQIPVGGTTANITGTFGAPVTWPVIPIHVVLLPDGRVMGYGSGATGLQGAELIYDVWNPTLGTDSDSHLVLPNTTKTDIFCGAQSVMVSGEVLTGGGDLTINGMRNFANTATDIFSPAANTIAANTPMNYARWYASLVGLPNGKLAIFGGKQNIDEKKPIIPVVIPELYDPTGKSWTPLTGVDAFAAFGSSWYYPRSYVAPGGNVFMLGLKGDMFFVSTDGAGSVVQAPGMAPAGNIALPTIPFAPGFALSVRLNKSVVVVDYRTSTPVVTATDDIDQVRYWASGSILADGRVLVTGGSEVANKLTGIAYQAQIWDPQTGHWTAGAVATKPRLYHSNSMLLPDATVLTGGGGAPGPVKNLNAEIYYPPYLYAADGTAAVRPVITATSAQAYNPGDTLGATVGPTDVVTRLNFIRTGSATHVNNSDQRFINLPFQQVGQNLTAVLPSDTSILVPGFYMLFAFNSAGVPSVAKIVNVAAGVVSAPSFTLAPSALAFGPVQSGNASAPMAATVTNTSTAALPAPVVALIGPSAASFSQTNTCGSGLAAGSSCLINVVFKPAASSYTFATLKVSSAGIIQTALLDGTGTVPFTVSPATLAFGTVAVSSKSASLTATVTDSGAATLTIASVTLGGVDPGDYALTNNCGSSIAAGSSCTIAVVFAPTTIGYRSAKLNVAAPGATHSIVLYGKGE